MLLNNRVYQGRIQRFWKGGGDQKVDLNIYGEAIKNALNWRKPDFFSFIRKKGVVFIRKSYLKLKRTNHICYILHSRRCYVFLFMVSSNKWGSGGDSLGLGAVASGL